MLTRRLFVALAAALLAACGEDEEPTGSGSVAGTYTLRTVNGSSLPFTLVQIGSDRYEVTAGHVTLDADGTFSQSTTFRLTEGGTVEMDTETGSGIYTRSGDAITFSGGPGEPETATATLTGGALTFVVADEGGTLTVRYTK